MMETTLKFFNIEKAKEATKAQSKETVHVGVSQWIKAYFSLINRTMAMK